MDLQNLVLRPNCLITPSELIFVPGPRSLFFYRKPHSNLPEFLYEHGYRTQVLSVPFRGSSARRLALAKWLQTHTQHSYHFIMDDVTFVELEPMLNHAQIQSITVITADTETDLKSEPNQKSFLFQISKKRHRIPLLYRLHQLFNFFYHTRTSDFATTFTDADRTTYDRFLDHCVKLAENELYA